MPDNAARFSSRVADYVKYRPSYPASFLHYLAAEVGFGPESVVADIGAGTGILSKPLAGQVKQVFAVEPNAEMRLAALEYCKNIPNIEIIDGAAEAAGLPDGSVDFITAAQAFHWFRLDEARQEFRRILRPGGKVVLVWNVRGVTAPFGAEYEALVRQHCLEYLGSGGGSGETLPYRLFFKDGCYQHGDFPNDRRLDLETLIGYSLSTSYAPVKGDSAYPRFIQDLVDVFNKYAENGTVLLATTAQSYVGEV
ncbi:methyltransferase domain-containing protein [Dehalogenimonas alkenigignens]|uniref:Methyltransferase domain n=1 Tax=Dehalogenimonas alkenigignens TaxID=1217799 RepID=A0A0W0GFW3_9CHLR|nr:methyltransferase domain-containing protein [Dehalogenimonas alkenigignens]KTB47440.1 Methyltransferase domain [Dehalogenimonas alkenigignens]PVV83498.1 methyltransferase domain-containing protein [Dehalogenimonas alkenigignens]